MAGFKVSVSTSLDPWFERSVLPPVNLIAPPPMTPPLLSTVSPPLRKVPLAKLTLLEMVSVVLPALVSAPVEAIEPLPPSA